MTEQPHNPLHGITLEAILTALVERHGWEALAQRINIRCFANDPSIKSSLTFLRKTPWARQKVEAWYLYDMQRNARRSRGDTGRPQNS
ncbi:MAG: VF530 family protein [Planctomycetaceae bacterium]|nr:VF530 family protein [Planctomycetaceae bacterium]